MVTDEIVITEKYFRFDWFKCFIRSESPYLIRSISDQLFRESMLLDSNKILGQKFWHKIYGGEDFKIMLRNSPTASQIQEHLYCLELPGKFFNSYSVNQFHNLCCWLKTTFENVDVRRVDIACDYFPHYNLAARPWELYLQSKKLGRIHTVKRICSTDRDNLLRSTCYLGSRQGEQVVRLYSKELNNRLFDRWEVELKRHKAQELVDNFIDDFQSILSYFLGSINLDDCEDWFKAYKISEGLRLSPIRQECSIHKSLRFFESLAPSMAMLYECFGVELFDIFKEIIAAGESRLKPRHRAAVHEYYREIEESEKFREVS